jgi:GNAT superfamily N-acetyltransferase
VKAPPWHEEPIAKLHDRKGFDCGVEALNTYLRRFARQNHESGGSKTFVAVPDAEPTRILGYYTISPGAIEYARVPGAVTRRLGQYEVPVFRLGRLAVAVAHQGQGLGAQLLLGAGERALFVAAVAGGVALAIDAKDERAARWYEGFGAMRLLDDPSSLVLPLQTVAGALEAAGRRSRG